MGRFVYKPVKLKEVVSEDPGDDKFISCALRSRCKTIISGDKHLLRVNGYAGIEILKLSSFVNNYLQR